MKAALLRWVRFAAVGSLGTGVQLSMMALLTGPAGLHYLPSTAMSVESAILHNFLWHEGWTWGDCRLAARRRLLRLLRFHGTTGVVSILGNLLFTRLYVVEGGFEPVTANLGAIATCAALNFLVNDRFVFADLRGKARHA